MNNVMAGTWIFYSWSHPIGLYSSVDQNYVTSNNFDDFYTVDCSGLGFKKCSFSPSIEGPNGGGLISAVYEAIHNIELQVEGAISNDDESDHSDEGFVKVFNTDNEQVTTTYVVNWKYDFNTDTEVTKLEIHIEE